MSVDNNPTRRYAFDMPLQYDSDSPLALAVRKVGSQVAFGQLIGKRQSVINDWLREEAPLPVEYVEVVEAATGISRHDLRPDLSKLFRDMSPPASSGPAGDMAPAVAGLPAAGATSASPSLESPAA